MSIVPKVAASLAGAAATFFMATQTVLADDAPAPGWTNFYIGGFVGGGAVNNNLDVLGGLFEFDGIGGQGFVGGGFVGFNYQISPQFVLGIQGELGVSDLETNISTPILGGISLEAAPQFNAALSGRAGWLANPNALVYIIGGYSYAEYETKINLPRLGSIKFDENYHGFHIGAGIEARITESLTARIEYRYTEYQDEDWGTGGAVEVEPSSHTGTLGVAWNFYTPELNGGTVISPTADMITSNDTSETADWTGPYVGAFIGGGAAVNDLDVLGGLLEFDGVGGEGFVGGGFAGFNYQVGPSFVVGVQAEIGVADLQTDISTPILGGISLEAAPDFNVALSGRFGWLADPETLLYIIGGYSYAEYETEINFGAGSVKFDEEYDGFHVGAGIEARITDSLTARVEYRYTKYGEEDWGTGGAVEVEPASHTGTIGIAWNFFGLL